MPRANVAGDLHSQNPAPHLDTDAPGGAPREGRWGGERPDLTPARVHAIAEKRAYARELNAGTFQNVAGGGAFARAHDHARPLLAVAEDESLATLPARALRLLAALRDLGEQGALLTHAELAQGMGATVATARRTVALLVAQKLLRTVPYFDPNDPALCRTHEGRLEALARKAPHSRRGNLYAPLLTTSAKKHEQASGTVPTLEHGRSGSSQPPPRTCPRSGGGDRERSMAVHGCGQRVPEGRQAKAESPAAALPATRQAETRNVAQKAPDVGGRDEIARTVADLVGELAANATRYEHTGQDERTAEYLRELAAATVPKPVLTSVPSCRICGCGLRAGRTTCRPCAEAVLASDRAVFLAKKGDGGAAS